MNMTYEEHEKERKRLNLLHDEGAFDHLTDVSDPHAVRDTVDRKLKIEAMKGEMWAVKEYNKMYNPNGMNDRVQFEMPSLEDLDSKGLSLILKTLLIALSKGQIGMKQFEQLTTIVRNVADTTEVAELADRIEAIEDAEEFDGDEFDDDILRLEDYQSRDDLTAEQREQFHGTKTNAVILGKSAQEFNKGRHNTGDAGGQHRPPHGPNREE